MPDSGADPRVLLDGEAAGAVLCLEEPLSFWGGLDPETGLIIDRRHPQHGMSMTGRVVVMPGGRGSSSSSTVLAEAIRLGTAPAAIVLTEPDAIIVLGALIARELYGTAVPILLASEPPGLRTGETARIGPDGSLVRETG